MSYLLNKNDNCMYKIVTGKSLLPFQHHVERALKEGYVLVGIAHRERGLWTQTLIKSDFEKTLTSNLK